MSQLIEKSNALIRWILVASNLVILILCIAVISVGVWTIGFKSFISGLLTDRLFLSCAYLQVIAGILCLLNSLFGFYSSYKEVKSLLVVYLAVSTLMLTILVMGGVMAYVFRHQIQLNMKSQLMSDLRRYDPEDSDNVVTRSWDRTQTLLQCCGIKTVQVEHAWQIWKYNPAVNVEVGQEIIVPRSCCRDESGTCNTSSGVIVDRIWTDDCYHKSIEFLQVHSFIMGSVTVSAAVSMVFGIFFSVLLLKRIR